MANEFKIKKGLIVNGSGSTILDIQGSQGQLLTVTDNFSGSILTVKNTAGSQILQVSSDDSVKLGTFNAEAIKVSGSNAIITGSLFGTSSWAVNSTNAGNSLSSSYAATASYAPSYLPLTGGTINGNVTVNGTASIAFLNVTYESASVIYSSGSNIFGDAVDDTQTLNGTVIVSGSQQITGSLNVSQGITGSLFGTASYVNVSTLGGFIQNGNSFGTTALLGTNDEQSLALETSGSERMRITSAGNIGIGTTAPTGKLHIAAPGALSTDIALKVRNSADTTDLFAVAGNGSVGISSGAVFYTLGNNLNFRSFLIGGSGYVLDTTSYNTINSTTNEQGFGNFYGTYAPTSGTGVLNGLKITPTINQTGGANGVTRGLYINPTLTAAANFRAIETTVGNVLLGTTSGNVGIGTTTPSASIDVVGGNILVNYQSSYGSRNSINNIVPVLSVGTGTMSGLTQSNLYKAGYTGTNGFEIGVTSAVGIYGIDSDGTNVKTFGIYTNNVRRLTIDSSGSLRVSGSASITGSLTVTQGITGSLFGTSSWANSATTASFATTASYVNTLNQNVLITGSLTVGSSSLGASENTITLGARDNGSEGGQLGFNAPGGTYTSASMLDNYTNLFRILRGTNAGSDALVAQWNMHNKQMSLPAYTSPTSFTGTTLVGLLGFDSSGNIITTTTGSGGGGGGVTINNNTDNYIVTATGTANTLNGESGLQYNGTSLTVTGQVTASGAITSNANGAMYFRGGDDAEFWDINVANTVGIYGQQTQTVAGLKLGSAGATLFGSASRFGIGTITPVATLDINGNLYVASGITGSLFGTASWAQNVTTATNALSASNFVITSTLQLDGTLTDYATVNSTIVGSNNLYQQATGSYTSAFVKYTLTKGANVRAGQFMTAWSGSTTIYTDTSTGDLGNTSDIVFSSTIVTSQIQINATAASSGWKIKTLATFI